MVRFDTVADIEANASVFAEAVSAIDHQRVLASVLDKYNGINGTVSIDKVELDLGQVDIANLGDLEGELARLLDEALAERMSVHRQVQPAHTATSQSPAHNEPEGKEQVADEYSTEQLITLLLYYFRRGALPWNVSGQPDIAALTKAVLQKAPGEFARQLFPLLQHTDVVRRIVYAVEDALCLEIVRLYMSPEDWAAVSKLSDVVAREMPSPQRQAFDREMIVLYLTVLTGAGSGGVFASHSFLMAVAGKLQERVAYITDATHYDIAELLRHEDNAVYQRVYQSLLLLVERLLASGTNDTIPAREASDEISLPENRRLPAAGAEAPGDQMGNEFFSDNGQEDEHQEMLLPEEEEPVGTQVTFIDNAGLVLLAPFLPMAFRRLGWISNDAATGEEQLDKMLLWMDYLVWGPRKVFEYSLSLSKVLAGVAPGVVVNIAVALTADEMEEADSLLAAAIQQWSVLKNTSVEGFRTSFLQRRGKLSGEDGGWQLYVEPKAFDMLLDSLPWSISIIKFKWMEKPLYTQWQTRV